MYKVKYALVGFGGIAENRIAKEGFACDSKRFRPLRNAKLVGATDVNPARRTAVEALGLGWYPNLDEILADSAVDAVFVATNNASHAKIATAALRGYGTMFQLSGGPGDPIEQRIEIDDGRHVKRIPPAKKRNLYQAVIERHARSVLDGKSLDATDAIHNLALCAAVHKSARSGGKLVTIG